MIQHLYYFTDRSDKRSYIQGLVGDRGTDEVMSMIHNRRME